jgi:toxin CcdB
MARFDLYENPSSKSRGKSSYLLDVQSEHLCGTDISRYSERHACSQR